MSTGPLTRVTTATNSPRRARFLALCAVIGSLLVSWTWAVISPPGSSPDEGDHITYAWGVVTGQVMPWNAVERDGARATELVNVTYPIELLDRPATGCYKFKPEVSPCLTTERELSSLKPNAEGLVASATYMARYPMLYYAAIGAVEWIGLSLGLSGFATLVAARVVSALIFMSLIMWSASILWRRFKSPVVFAVFSLFLTPQALSLAGAINPNGFEIAAAVAFATAVIAIRHHAMLRITCSRELGAFAAISALCLAMARPASMIWMCILGVILLAPTGRGSWFPIRALPRWSHVLVWLSAAMGIAWFLYEQAGRDGGASNLDTSAWQATSGLTRFVLIVLHFGKLVWQGYTLLFWADTTMPTLFFVLWLILFALLGAGAIFAQRRVSTSAAFAWFFLGMAIVAVMLQSNKAAFGWQGRYFTPVLVAFAVLLLPQIIEGYSTVRSKVAVKVSMIVATMSCVVTSASAVIVLFRFVYGYKKIYERFDWIPVPTEAHWLPAGFSLKATLAMSILGPVLLLISVWGFAVSPTSSVRSSDDGSRRTAASPARGKHVDEFTPVESSPPADRPDVDGRL